MKDRFKEIVKRVGRVVLGKEDQIGLALTCLFARGHLLIEDIPGIGKTTLAQGLARSLGLGFRRVQFTSDLLPGDVLGVSVFDQAGGTFVFHPGSIFTHVLLADEINRATPKTQSALLEAMEERQVTVEGETRALEEPFFVIGTQNPIEHSGTYPLPDSQLDRFLIRIDLGYPGREAEKRLLETGETKGLLADLPAVLTPADVLEVQRQVDRVKASPALTDYVLDLLEFTRTAPHFHVGLSPRAGLGILRTARAWAYVDGRDFVLPEDVAAVLPWVVAHRLRAAGDLGEIPRKKLNDLFKKVPVP